MRDHRQKKNADAFGASMRASLGQVQSFCHVVRGHQFTDSAHMAGGTRRSLVISGLPGIRGGIPLPTVAFGIVDVSVFAVIENLNVGVIRTKVTGSTCSPGVPQQC